MHERVGVRLPDDLLRLPHDALARAALRGVQFFPHPLRLCAVALFFPAKIELGFMSWQWIRVALVIAAAAVIALALDTILFFYFRPSACSST